MSNMCKSATQLSHQKKEPLYGNLEPIYRYLLLIYR